MKLAYTIQEASEATSLSRGLLYRLAAEGKITLRKSAGRTVILAGDLQTFLADLPLASAKKADGRNAA